MTKFLKDKLSSLRFQTQSTKDQEELFSNFYSDWKQGGAQLINEELIPKFYYQLREDSSEIQIKLREEARLKLLEKRRAEILSSEELEKLFDLLESEKYVSYEKYREVVLSSPRFEKYFGVKTYAQLMGKKTRVRTEEVCRYGMKKTWEREARAGLALYDSGGQGWLSEADLEEYLADLMPSLAGLSGLTEAHRPYYLCTVARHLTFSLDPAGTGRVRATALLSTGLLDSLLHLRDVQEPEDGNTFSQDSFLKLYGQYLNLDTDQDGLLSKEELASYGTGSLTPLFLDRVFQECPTYSGLMDFKSYLDFVIAMENKDIPQAVNYFFKILDLDGKGHLTSHDLYAFYSSIKDKMGQQPEASFEDFEVEIFDALSTKDPMKITLKDLQSSPFRGEFISCLIDVDGFLDRECQK